MAYNTMINKTYWGIWAKLPELRDNENGAEAIEWIALVAILVFMMTFVYAAISKGGGKDLATAVITNLISWVGKVFGKLKL